MVSIGDDDLKNSSSASSLSSVHMSTRKEAVKMQLEPNEVLNESGTLMDHWMDQDSAAALGNGETNGTHDTVTNDDGLRQPDASETTTTITPSTAEDSADIFKMFRWSKALPDDEFEYRRHVFGYSHQTHMLRNQSPLQMEKWFRDFDFDAKKGNAFVSLLKNAIRAGGKMSSSTARRKSAMLKSSPVTLRKTIAPNLPPLPSPTASLRASKSFGFSPAGNQFAQRRSFLGAAEHSM